MKIIVKNRKLLVFIVLLISSAVSKGQIYKYIGLEDGLNNQKIYHIQKDRRGSPALWCQAEYQQEAKARAEAGLPAQSAFCAPHA